MQTREESLSTSLGTAPDWRWGGASAAWRLTGYYRGDESTLYLEAPESSLPIRLGLVLDPTGPIALFRTPGVVAFQSPVPRTVNPLIAYLDLLSTGDDRAHDAARQLQAQYLSDLQR
ncbi:MAG: hypothetical protein IV100_15440 [Myxococcales bacterium]|nr:hypothetical protein [Myxococcales bacterium]